MPHVLPPPGACPCRCPGSCPGSCRARARHIPAGRAVRLPCGAWERPSSAEEGMRGGPSARRNMRAAEYFPRFLPLLPPFFSRILSLPGSFRHRPPCGAWERPSSAGRGCGAVRPPVGICGRRSIFPGSFRCCRPSFPESFLSPVPSAIVLPAAHGSGPPLRGGDAGRSVRPSECAGGGVFSPVPFAAALLSPVPSAIALPAALGSGLLLGEGMRGGPSARRNVRAAECFSPVPSAATALLFPVPVRAARKRCGGEK